MKICCLVGESGSGKSTLTAKLVADYRGVKRLVTYTTRPARAGEVNGVDYHFVTDVELDQFAEANKLVVSENFPPMGRFAIVNDGQVDQLSRTVYLVDGSLARAAALQKFYGTNKVDVVHVYVDDETRLLRMLGRAMAGDRNYRELCRRFLADKDDYAAERFAIMGLHDVRLENINLTDAVDVLATRLGLRTSTTKSSTIKKGIISGGAENGHRGKAEGTRGGTRRKTGTQRRG